MKTLATAALALFVLAACARQNAEDSRSPSAQTESSTAVADVDTASTDRPVPPAATGDTFAMPANPQTTASGLKYQIDQEGTGPVAATGQTVSVHYTGWLTDGKEFDSSRGGGSPLEFTLGAKRVIAGWEEGITGMKVGEKRTLVIPPSIGYGESGMGPIPPNATLVFKVELVGVR